MIGFSKKKTRFSLLLTLEADQYIKDFSALCLFKDLYT